MINTPLLLLWIQLLCSVAGIILLTAWAFTGRKNSTLRVLGGICIFAMAVIGFYKLMTVGYMF